MTGDSTDSMLIEGTRFGLFGFIDKPINRLALIVLIEQAIECYRLRQEVTELRRILVDSGVRMEGGMPGVTSQPEKMAQPRLLYGCPLSLLL